MGAKSSSAIFLIACAANLARSISLRRGSH
jgi:hypothetical protein